jgi:hypothetical protein
MGSALNEVEGALSAERIYKKPTLKRHGLVSELTRGGGGGFIDNYDGYYATYS